MLYHLLQWLEVTYEPPGFQVFNFITVRASLAAVTALAIALFAGKKIIRFLRARQLGETIREGVDAGAVSHEHKAGTPTMGGVIIILALCGATLLWGDLTNPYILLILLATLWMGAIGFADDYIKVVMKNKQGVNEWVKIGGQTTLGLFLGAMLYFLPTLRETNTLSSLPFIADGTFDYDFLSPIVGFDIGWLIYIPIVVFIVTAVSNAVNITDGLDGLTTGTSAFVAIGLIGLCYITGNVNLADFVNDIYLPQTGELTVFAAAMAAACFGFLWYNGYPAQVFMGDTGSLALGAAIGTLALMIKKELLLPVLCAIFFVETLSVIIQTVYFKYTKRTTGEGKRVFKMAPLHHHYEALGVHEAKIVVRFWIVTAMLVIATLLVLRIR
ncbi:MAG: phospho-N-acetylmuramoyl-pentapeptide-transferase [Rhodothermales bacterium]